MKNIFENASRLRLRFVDGIAGTVNVEDLWALSLSTLNNLAKATNNHLKLHDEEDFIGNNTAITKDTQLHILRLDILKHVIASKLAAKKVAENIKLREKNNALILDLISKKEGDALNDKSIEELKKLIE